jgi:oxygen-independent coproporphyrinogen III oxidase
MIPASEKSVVGLYFHVPFCVKKCDYCDFYSVAGRAELAMAFADGVERELSAALDAHGPLTADTVYFGGGTPSSIPPEIIARILAAARARFPFEPAAEITLECNPCTLTREKARAWKAMGVNRVSLGVQSFDDKDLAFLGRAHSGKEAREALALLREEGMDNINADFIFGIPGQSASGFRENLAQAVAADVPHLSVYGLSIEENTPLFNRYREGAFDKINDETYEAFFLTAHAFLKNKGFSHYEISNYAMPGRAACHNMNCWNGSDFLGFGPAAHSRMGARRWANRPDLEAYRADPFARAFDIPLDAGEARMERIMLGLRCASGADVRDFSNAEAVTRLKRRSLIHEEDGRIRLTQSGMLLLDEIILFLEGDKCLISK